MNWRTWMMTSDMLVVLPEYHIFLTWHSLQTGHSFIYFLYIVFICHKKAKVFPNSWLVSAILLYVLLPLLAHSPEYYFYGFLYTLTSEDRMLGTSLVSDDVISGNEPITGLLSSQAIWNVTSDWLIQRITWEMEIRRTCQTWKLNGYKQVSWYFGIFPYIVNVSISLW